MKYFILILTLSVIFFSCIKKNPLPRTLRVVGYIYNSNDSTPFKNTKFKLYYRKGWYDADEEYFYTDSVGHFDYSTTTMSSGGIYWPSYFEGAAYLGPPKLGIGKRDDYNEENNTWTTYYDTLYTTPYQ